MALPDSTRRILGAIAGGALGFLVHGVALMSGIHTQVAVGAGVGLGGGLMGGRRSIAWGIGIGTISLGLTLLVEWPCWRNETHVLSSIPDHSFGYFITHPQDLEWKRQLSFVAAAGIGFWFGMGRNPKERADKSSQG